MNYLVHLHRQHVIHMARIERAAAVSYPTARPVPPPPIDGDGDNDNDQSDQTSNAQPGNPTVQGYYSCSALEHLWTSVGGNPGSAFIAAEIAMAESGGYPYALSPTNDYGLWQINGSHGPGEATFNPVGNARAAIAISGNGTDWTPWTTYVTGAYIGRC